MSTPPTITLYGFDFIGPIPLNGDIVAVLPADRYGVYSLGTQGAGGYLPRYFGRSDTCVKTRLHDHVGAGLFPRFCVRLLDTLWEAYTYECKLVHAFAGAFPLTNKNHPAKPAGKTWPCPVCGQ